MQGSSFREIGKMKEKWEISASFFIAMCLFFSFPLMFISAVCLLLNAKEETDFKLRRG